MGDRHSGIGVHLLGPVALRAIEHAETEHIELIRFLYADHGGVIRGKAVSRSRLPERFTTGIGHTVAMMAMNMLDQLQNVEHLGPVGEVRLVPDPTTFVPLPYAPGAAAMLSDLRRIDGSPGPAARAPSCARRSPPWPPRATSPSPPTNPSSPSAAGRPTREAAWTG